MSTNFIVLKEQYSVLKTLDIIRQKEISDKIVYFYIINQHEQLIGVVPIRKLITSTPDQILSEIMITNVVTIDQNASLTEAAQVFSSHKYLALPVINDQRKMVGVIDVNIYSNEALDYARMHERIKIFELIGFRFSNLETDSPLKSFSYRLPWLSTTLISGLFCAFLSYKFQFALEKSIILLFFTALILGLGESVSIQSMSATLELLEKTKVSMKQYIRLLKNEIVTASLLGTTCGLLSSIPVYLIAQNILIPSILGISIFVALLMACVIGLTIPSIIHALKLDPKIAAGPITLAITDIISLFFYFSIAYLLI